MSASADNEVGGRTRAAAETSTGPTSRVLGSSFRCCSCRGDRVRRPRMLARGVAALSDRAPLLRCFADL